MGKERIEKQRQFHELETLVKSLEAVKVRRELAALRLRCWERVC
jgi:hypothetical protein